MPIDSYDDGSQYKVYCTQPPPCPGFPYITLGIGNYNAKIDDITVMNSPSPDITVSQPSFSDSSKQYFAAIGYQFADYGFLNRFEVVATRREALNYDPNPAINVEGLNTSMSSTIKNYSILGKLYWDLYRYKFLVPYIQGGAGVSVNSVNSTASDQLPPFTPVVLTSEQSKTNFAWDAGVGIRAVVTKYLFVDLGYEHDYLGSGLQWQVPSFSSSGTPLTLESGSFSSNAYNLAVTFNFR